MSDEQLGLRSRVESADSGEVTWRVGLGGPDRLVRNTGWPRDVENMDSCSFLPPPFPPPPALNSREHAEDWHARAA